MTTETTKIQPKNAFKTASSGLTANSINIMSVQARQKDNVLIDPKGYKIEIDEDNNVKLVGRDLKPSEIAWRQTHTAKGAKDVSVPSKFGTPEFEHASIAQEYSAKIEKMRPMVESLLAKEKGISGTQFNVVAPPSIDTTFENNFGFDEPTSTAPQAQTIHYDHV